MAPDESSSLQVRSEIGRLRRVLIHRPGLEIDWMVPAMMDRLLFDDILYGEDARAEHDRFRAVLEAAGVEALDPQTLLAEVLEDSAARDELMGGLQNAFPTYGEPIAPEIRDELADLEAAKLAEVMVAGLRVEDGAGGESMRSFYRLAPLPNYFFQRDPQVVFGDHVLVSAMATSARSREARLSAMVFEHHPALGRRGEHIRLEGDDERLDLQRRALVEGGDVLVPRHDVLMIGVSERTNRHGVDSLARHLLGRSEETGFRYIIAVEIPPRRSYMHLDTVFTFIDRDLCLAYLPVIAPGGAEAGTVYLIDLEKPEVTYTLCDHVPGALARVGIDIELVPCGGSASLIDQQREQWTDGANAFALAPGVLTLYRRNRRTAEELDRRGFRIVDAEDVVAGREPVLGAGRTAVVIDDNELSRARGGPRCMTMPLHREAVE